MAEALAPDQPGLAPHGRTPARDERLGQRAGRASAPTRAGKRDLAQKMGRPSFGGRLTPIPLAVLGGRTHDGSYERRRAGAAPRRPRGARRTPRGEDVHARDAPAARAGGAA